MAHVSLAIFDYSNKKVCELYDSDALSSGQAYNICKQEEIKQGWKELTFDLPLKINKEKNFRWDYIKNDYLVRVREGNETDWYLIKTPKKTKSGGIVTNAVRCVHISTNLKTKNLYLTYDDTNGIGTIRYLVNRALTNTGWMIGTCDTFYESDGVTEKVRSYSSNGKRGSYQIITDICNIFNAYPIYHGDTKTVDIRALANKYSIGELYVGKNQDTLSEEKNSDNIVTRLYVEGQYSNNGYVGIESANPTGLPFLLNFDYYRENGMITSAQQAAVETYKTDRYNNNQAIIARMTSILEGENLLNEMWGQISYVIYQLTNGVIDNTKTIYGGTVLEEQKTIHEGDKLLVFKATGNYREVVAGAGGSVSFASNDVSALKFVTKAAGKIGAREVAIESKEKMIVNTQRQIDNLFEFKRNPANRYADVGETVTFTVELYNPQGAHYQWQIKRAAYGSTWTNIGTDSTSLTMTAAANDFNGQVRCVATNAKNQKATSTIAILYEGDGENIPSPISEPSQRRQYYLDQIESYEETIEKIYNGDEQSTGLYEAMRAAVELAIDLDRQNKLLAGLQEEQEEIEGTFSQALGDQLKDGYWANTNYAPGQEQELYHDAVSYLNQASKPTVKYSLSLIRLPELLGFTEGIPVLNAKVKILDEDLGLKDIAYVSKRSIYLDDKEKGSIEISNEDIVSAITKTFDDVMTKVTQLADLVEQRNAVYERARAINANGTLPAENLEGALDLQTHAITSPNSLWHTDETGAMIFESADGESAFKITGEGILIAHEQIAGEWNWESALSGSGVSGGSISGGYIDPDLIEDGAFTIDKFSDEFQTQYYQDEQKIELTAQQTNLNGAILNAAGLSVDANGVIVYSNDAVNGIGSRFNVQAEAISARVEKGEVATQLTVEVGNVSISNGNLLVDGYVQSDALYSSIAALDQVYIKALNAGSITSDTYWVGETIPLHTAIRSIAVDNSAPYGKIGFTYKQCNSDTTYAINFNIADTQYFQDGVSAARAAGKASVSALIVDGNNNPVSGRHTLASGKTMTVYPATYVDGITSRNNGAALVITAK